MPENYFLASARFIVKKNLPRLIQAYAQYRDQAETRESGKQKAEIWSLVLLGDGPLKSDLCRLISDIGLQNTVLLPGFKQYDELPAFYALARAFVHASAIEQWGLVVNEAMASGLPVIVSNRCGCATDLVQEGRNGFTFDPYNVGQLAELMTRISAVGFPLPEIGATGRNIIASWGLERFAAGFQGATELAVKSKQPRSGLVNRLLLKALMRK